MKVVACEKHTCLSQGNPRVISSPMLEIIILHFISSEPAFWATLPLYRTAYVRKKATFNIEKQVLLYTYYLGAPHPPLYSTTTVQSTGTAYIHVYRTVQTLQCLQYSTVLSAVSFTTGVRPWPLLYISREMPFCLRLLYYSDPADTLFPWSQQPSGPHSRCTVQKLYSNFRTVQSERCYQS